MLRQGAEPDDLVLVIRATPATLEDAVEEVVVRALVSADTYIVDCGRGRELLYGVSVFARRHGVEPREVLARFSHAPTYLELTVGAIRACGLPVLPTGENPDHFDIQLVPGLGEGERAASPAALEEATSRLFHAAEGLRPNPAYDDRSG